MAGEESEAGAQKAGRLRIEGDIGLADTLLGVLCRPF